MERYDFFFSIGRVPVISSRLIERNVYTIVTCEKNFASIWSSDRNRTYVPKRQRHRPDYLKFVVGNFILSSTLWRLYIVAVMFATRYRLDLDLIQGNVLNQKRTAVCEVNTNTFALVTIQDTSQEPFIEFSWKFLFFDFSS